MAAVCDVSYLYDSQSFTDPRLWVRFKFMHKAIETHLPWTSKLYTCFLSWYPIQDYLLHVYIGVVGLLYCHRYTCIVLRGMW